MAFPLCGVYVLVLSVLLCQVDGHRSHILILQSLRRLYGDVNSLKSQVPEIEGRAMNEISLAQEYLESKLMESLMPSQIERMVDEYLIERFSEGGIEDMSKEIQDLSTQLEMLRAENTKLMRRIRVLEQDERRMKQETEEKYQQVKRDVKNVTDIVISLSKNLTTSQADVQRVVKIVNNLQKCECQINTDETVAVASSSTPHPPTLSSSPPTRKSFPGDISEEKDILVAPYEKEDYFKRFNLNNDTVSNFTLRLEKVYSVIYVPSTRSLLISLHDFEDKLISYDTETYKVKTVRLGFLSYGMTVDETRNIVFMTTVAYWRSISRLDVDGSRFRVLTRLYAREPYGIAVDPVHEIIYVCVMNQILSVNYRGNKKKTVYSGNFIYSVTRDGSNLYFIADDKLIMRDLTTNVNRDVISMEGKVYTIVYYNNNVYTLNVVNNYLNAIQLGNETHNATYHKLHQLDTNSYSMCLIPASDA